jgi:glyoxylase-like metal-dependent hydrolase (beta-lactamase superfamily II)
MALSGNLAYDVLVNDPPPQDGVLPNGEPKRFSPQASTLIYGREDAVLTDPGLTAEQARAVGDWVTGKGLNLTDIFITHGHGDHWFAAGLLADRFGARVVASAGTIGQMRASAATRPLLWDKLYPGLIPPAPVTAVTVPGNRFALEGHDLVIVETGDTDSADSTVLHVPDLGLVVAGRTIAETRRPRRRGRAAEHREHRDRLLQRQDCQVPGPSRADGPVGKRQSALRRPRTPRGQRRPDHPQLLALTYAT